MRVWLFLLFICCIVASTPSAFAITPYQADYAFKMGKIASSKATRTLSKTGAIWTYQFDASILKIGNASEKTSFNFADGIIKPLLSDFNMRLLLRKTQRTLKFNYAKSKIDINDTGTQKTINLPSAAQDNLTVELQIREDLKQGKLRASYNIVDEDGNDTVTFVVDGPVHITTPHGQFDTIKVHRVHSNAKRRSEFWLAPELDYLPVRLLHQGDGMTYEMNLTGYKPLSTAP